MNIKKIQIIIGAIVVAVIATVIMLSQKQELVDSIDLVPTSGQISTSTEKSVSVFIQAQGDVSASVISGIQTQNINSSNVIVSWITSVPVKTEILFATVPPAQNVVLQMIRDTKLKMTHAVELTSLAPNTTYYYTIVSSGDKIATTTIQGLFKTINK